MRYNYPRVTEIIRLTDPDEKRQALIRWQKKQEQIFGIEGAEIESEKRLDYGTRVHSDIELYLKGAVIDFDLISSVKPLLDAVKCFGKDLIIERRLYSHKYQFTGKPDLICTYDDKLTVFDWTTSARRKIKKYLEHKFIQAGAYAIAHEETTGEKIEQLIVVTILDKYYQTFTEPPEPYIAEFKNRLENYHSLSKTNI